MLQHERQGEFEVSLEKSVQVGSRSRTE